MAQPGHPSGARAFPPPACPCSSPSLGQTPAPGRLAKPLTSGVWGRGRSSQHSFLAKKSSVHTFSYFISSLLQKAPCMFSSEFSYHTFPLSVPDLGGLSFSLLAAAAPHPGPQGLSGLGRLPLIFGQSPYKGSSAFEAILLPRQ